MNEPYMDRLIGRKAILSVIESMYGITTWKGVMYFVKRNKVPLRRTPSGKPMLFRHELIKFDKRYKEAF